MDAPYYNGEDTDYTTREVCKECGCVLEDEPHDTLCSYDDGAYEYPYSYEREDDDAA